MAHFTRLGATWRKEGLAAGVMVCVNGLRHRRRIAKGPSWHGTTPTRPRSARFSTTRMSSPSSTSTPGSVDQPDDPGMAKAMPASQAIGMASGMIGADKAEAIRAEVEALE